MNTSYEPTERTRLRRKAVRGSFDRDVVHSILDAGILAHVGYIAEGEPICTPTLYWREGEHVYWHAAAAGRALHAQVGQRVSFTVSHVDGLVLARSGFTHSMLYRSVMAFGRPELISDPAAKQQAMDAFLERLYPGRTRELRAPNEGELAAISVLRMALEEVSAKVREPGVHDREGDMAATCWAGTIPLAMTVGAIETDPNVRPGTPLTPSIASYTPGRSLEEALAAGVSR